MRKYPQEVENYVRENASGRRIEELARMTNEVFGTEFTQSKMKAFMQNCGIKNEMPKHLLKGGRISKVYPSEIVEFIMANYKGCGAINMTLKVNEVFGTNFTKEQMKGFYGRNKLDSGLNGRFEKGYVPANKGKKGITYPGSEKGWFEKGHIPINAHPVGTVMLREDGYLWQKVAEPNKWKEAHRILWEEHNGPIPKKMIVTFLDGDKTNIRIENLALITQAENLQLTRRRLRTEDSELTRTGILVAKLDIEVRKRKRSEKI